MLLDLDRNNPYHPHWDFGKSQEVKIGSYSLEDIMLNEKRDTKGQIFYDSIYMRCFKWANSLQHQIEWWLPGPEGVGVGKLLFNGYECQFRNIKKFWKQMAVMVAQPHVCTYCY